MPRQKKQYARVRHGFATRLVGVNGAEQLGQVMARVILATEPVTITLTADHVRRSIELNGVGNTSTCAAAICCMAHERAFPHPVEGHIDFQYSRAFVVCKSTKIGMPEESVVYEHRQGHIAKLNDAVGGQQALLAYLEKEGPLTIELLPYRPRSEVGRSGSHRSKSGTRDPLKSKGAKLRYTVYLMGGYPAMPRVVAPDPEETDDD